MTSLSLPRRALPLLVAVPLLATACSGGDGNDDPDGGPMTMPDAGPDIPDDAILCETDADCDDGIDCTSESCNDRGFCNFAPDNAMCQDDSFCNGVERCDLTEGCVPGPLETCDDSDVCTLDSCDEENDVCINVPRDFDQDGDPDQFCGGNDCNDRDPLVNSAISEICCDLRDNDCDGEEDEGSTDTIPCVPDGSGECGGPAHDSCSDALDVSDGGTFILSSQGALPDYSSAPDTTGFSCRSFPRPDLALRFTLDEAQDVAIATTGTFATTISLHEATMDPDMFAEEICRTVDTEVECTDNLRQGGFPPFRRRNLPAGTYFVLLRDESFTGSPELIVNVAFSEPTQAPTNETCNPDDPIDVSAGGSFSDSFVDVADDLAAITCRSVPDDHDLTYRFETTESQNVEVELRSDFRASMGFELRSACQVPDTAIGCVLGSTGSAGTLGARTFYQLPAGEYFVVLQSDDEADYVLDVAFGPPTPPPPGETCANPRELTPGTPFEGRLSVRSDDHDQSCAGANRDAVYSFELDDTQDVTVTVDGDPLGNFFVSMRLDNCAEEAAELTCRADGQRVFIRRRGLEAGTYFVIVEAFATDFFPAEHTITVETEDPVDATEAEDNDVCSDAVSVPAAGGFFTGSTIGLGNDFQNYGCGMGAESEDAVFEIELSETRRVVASTEGSGFDTVVSLWSGGEDAVCEGGIGPFDSDELRQCRDRVSLPRVVDRDLPAGTHWVVVDGWDTTSRGSYELDIAVLEP